jgi:hypothetical protein
LYKPNFSSALKSCSITFNVITTANNGYTIVGLIV